MKIQVIVYNLKLSKNMFMALEKTNKYPLQMTISWKRSELL